MLYQLINYYLTDLRKTVGLWEYIGTTVVIFQNAAILEVRKTQKQQQSENVLLIHGFGYISLDCACSNWYCTKQRRVDHIPGSIASNVSLWCFTCHTKCDLLTRTSAGSLGMVNY